MLVGIAKPGAPTRKLKDIPFSVVAV